MYTDLNESQNHRSQFIVHDFVASTVGLLWENEDNDPGFYYF
jgi:hypothetical protein